MADSDFLCLYCASVIPEDEVLKLDVTLAHHKGETPGPGQWLWAHLSCFQASVPEAGKWLLRPELGGPET